MRLKSLAAGLLAALCFSLAGPSFAALPLPSEVEFQLNRGSDAAQRNALGTQVTTKKVHVLKAQYDFAKSGGAISTLKLLDPFDGKQAALPGKAVITNCYIDVITAPVGTSATIALGTGQTGVDLKAATAITSFTAGSVIACIPVGSAATAIKLTNAKTTTVAPSMTIATTALTAGKFNVLIEYMLSD